MKGGTNKELSFGTSRSIGFSYIGEPDPKDHEDRFLNDHFDAMLQQSYVEFSSMGFKGDPIEEDEDGRAYGSGESYFKKESNANALYFSDIGTKKELTRLKHKKVQCQIGSGECTERDEYMNSPYTQRQRLEILKIIKLCRAVFKEARRIGKEVKRTVKAEEAENECFH